MSSYILDGDGDAWPITGHWCTACGWPLTPIRPEQNVHPWCAPNPNTASTDDAVDVLRAVCGATVLGHEPSTPQQYNEEHE